MQLFFAVWLLILVVAIITGLRDLRGAYWHRRAARAEAGVLGLQFDPGDPYEYRRYSPTPLLRGSYFIKNFAWGTVKGRSVCVFDRQIPSRLQKSAGETGVATELDGWLPVCTVWSMESWSRLNDLAREPKIEFESDAFNHRFVVTAADQRAAFALIDERMMAWMMQELAPYPEAILQCAGNLAVLLMSGREPYEWPELIDLIDRFVDRVPNSVHAMFPPPAPPDGAPGIERAR
jgi:hypothetical protein